MGDNDYQKQEEARKQAFRAGYYGSGNYDRSDGQQASEYMRGQSWSKWREDLMKPIDFNNSNAASTYTYSGPLSLKDAIATLAVIGILVVGIGIFVMVDRYKEIAVQEKLAAQREEEGKIESKIRERKVEIFPKAARTIYDYLSVTTRPLPSKQDNLIPGRESTNSRTDVLPVPGAEPDDKILIRATFPARIKGKECFKLNVELNGRDYSAYVGEYFKCQGSIFSAHDFNRSLSRYQEFAKDFGERHKVMVPGFYP